MTKAKKRVLFYFFLLIFLICTFVTILYAEGYQYDFARSSFVKTGAINLKLNTDADIYINDKFIRSTSFFSNSFRKDRVLPGIYNVRAERNGYSSWTKKITVSEGLVSDYSHIMILPTEGPDKDLLMIEVGELKTIKALPHGLNINIGDLSDYYFKSGSLYNIRNLDEQIEVITIANGVVGYVLSSDRDKIVWWNRNELYVYWKNIDKNELLTRFSDQIRGATWFRDSDHILVNAGTNKIVEIDSRGGVNIISL